VCLERLARRRDPGECEQALSAVPERVRVPPSTVSISVRARQGCVDVAGEVLELIALDRPAEREEEQVRGRPGAASEVELDSHQRARCGAPGQHGRRGEDEQKQRLARR
jgi:hypothetical protein